MSLKEFKTKFIGGVIELLWAQWCDLGVSGHAKTVSAVMLDPEALIVISSWAARYDERLYDLILSWLIANGDAVNLQRLKALARKSAFTDNASLRYMAAALEQAGGRKWSALANANPEGTEPTPLFQNADGTEATFCPRHDETALRFGFIRSPFVDRHLVVKPSLESPGSVLLRLRGLCGISARADILAALLDDEAKSAAELATLCGYTWKSINEALKELLGSGLLHELRVSARGNLYKLKDTKPLASMISMPNGKPVNWIAIFEAIGTVWQTVSNPRLELVSQETVRGEINQLTAKINSNLILSDFDIPKNEEQLCFLPQSVIRKCFKAE